ncbi:MAG TPA: hypothetical protein VF407_16190 [Polyangiaceae bacterium]
MQVRAIGSVVSASLAAVLFFLAPSARAQNTLLSPTGGKGQLVFDGITGLHVSPVGVGYSGVLGFELQNYSMKTTIPGGTANSTVHTTTVWFAPEADYFVINHLSVGGLLSIANTSGSVDVPTTAAVSVSRDLASTTDFTLMPRAGWMFALGDRFGIWPRLGLGYASRHNITGDDATFSGFLMRIDCPFLYRINETFFVSASPDFTFIPGSTSTSTNNNVTVSEGATFWEFGATAGLGIMLDL